MARAIEAVTKPSLEAGHVRLYRGEKAVRVGNVPDWMASTLGLWFTDDPATAARFGEVSYVDLPESELAQYATGYQVGIGGGREYLLSPALAAQKLPL